MKLLCNNNRKLIDENKSDSRIGAIRRNNTWILNGVINEVLKSKNNPPIVVKIVDVKQCFDGLWPEECINDLFNYGLQNDVLPLLYDGCSEIEIQVKTPIGITQ